jgi:hypothetical protein
MTTKTPFSTIILLNIIVTVLEQILKPSPEQYQKHKEALSMLWRMRIIRTTLRKCIENAEDDYYVVVLVNKLIVVTSEALDSDDPFSVYLSAIEEMIDYYEERFTSADS